MDETQELKRKLVIQTLEVQLNAVVKRWGEEILWEIPVLNELTEEAPE